MSAVSVNASPPDILPLPALLETLAALEVEWKRQGDNVAARDPHRVLTTEIKAAIAEHRDALLALWDLRAEFARLHNYIIRLRCVNPPKGTREDALGYLAAQIERLAARCDTASGYFDPEDPFADEALTALRDEYQELAAEGSPYPTPMDPERTPEDQGRRHNGRPV